MLHIRSRKSSENLFGLIFLCQCHPVYTEKDVVSPHNFPECIYKQMNLFLEAGVSISSRALNLLYSVEDL